MNLFGRYFVGIDVGISGFAAVLDIDSLSVEFHPLPVKYYPRYVKDKNGEKKSESADALMRNKCVSLSAH